MARSYTIRDLPNFDKPRERLQNLGENSLSAQELIALILGSGQKGESVLLLAQKLLSHFGTLQRIAQASLRDLLSIKGIGFAKACQIKACFEIGRRCFFEEAAYRPKGRYKGKVIVTPSQVYKLVRSKILQLSKEHFVVISFDVRNRILGIDTISIGILNANLVHPREIFDTAISRHASHIVIAHNHPSGEMQPSDEDVDVTKRLVKAGRIMGIEILDHVIVARGGYFSFKESGLM